MPRKAMTVDATGDTVVQSSRTILYGFDVSMSSGTSRVDFKDGDRVVFYIELYGNHTAPGNTGGDGSRRMSGLDIPFQTCLLYTSPSPRD